MIKCKRENSLDILKDSISAYTDEDVPKYKTVVTFDCRGIEPIDFSPRSGWEVEGLESGTKFDDVDLSDKD